MYISLQQGDKMTINKNIANNRNWNSKKLVELSNNLSEAYNPGLNNTQSHNTDVWTADKFIKMSRYLSSAYGVDF